MDFSKDLEQWLRKMGYSEQIPDSFYGICNNLTKFVWEQLIENVYPMSEARNIRRNIVLQRLEQKPLNKQDEFDYKLEDIEVYKQKILLEQKFKFLQLSVNEKKEKINHLAQKCKLKDVSLEFIKKKVSENYQRKYLLEKKKEQLELQAVQGDSSLCELKNITPIETDDSYSSAEVEETLTNCAKKLKELLKEKQMSEFQAPSTKTKINVTFFERSVATYLSTIEKHNCEDIAASWQKKKQMTNIKHENHNNVKQRLFISPETKLDTDKSVMDISNTSPLVPMESTIEHTVSKRSNRESLGLLHDYHFSQITDNEIFLQPTVPKIPFVHNKKDSKSALDFRLYNNVIVRETVQELLHKNNRELLQETLGNQIKQIKGSIKFDFIDTNNRKYKILKNYMTKLRFIHVQLELNVLKHKKTLSEINAKIGSKKFEILQSNFWQEHNDTLDSKMNQVVLKSSLKAMEEEIQTNMKKAKDEKDVISLKFKIKNDIENKQHLIEYLLGNIEKVQRQIAETNDSIFNLIWEVRTLQMGSDWIHQLETNIWLSEMKNFKDFPLEYQRSCTFTNNQKTFYRDLCIDSYPEVDSDETEMLLEILESPFLPPETVLLNLIEMKEKLQILKAAHHRYCKIPCEILQQNYSLQQLQKQESYVEYAIDRLAGLMQSSDGNKALDIGNIVKRSMEIWAELPMRNFLSQKRTHEGMTYEEYRKKLTDIMNN
ncbi:hypothetical protein ABEB36_005342 [Hypothenemus hampei]|uniref:Uncharacterized protein n=1 Tax=Hypothenemus hampei TaxID=57062 RepID=A0ABD1EY98_HYPHA